jgi:acetyl CoA:N6-hydroxylysine acetyl transferase
MFRISMSKPVDSLPETLRFEDAEVRRSANRLTALLGGETRVVLEWSGDSAVRTLELNGPEPARALTMALRAVFEWRPSSHELALELPEGVARDLARTGCVELCATRCSRAALAQHAPLWLRAERAAEYPLRLVVSDGKRHPVRPLKPSGVVYERHVATLDSVLRFRTIEPDRDLQRFHTWMNDPRISRVWELPGSHAQHRAYLEALEADRHTLPLIGELDGEPFGYFEVYWAKEDRIAPFYAADDYDRGLHVLVGEQRFRGPQRVAAWLSGLAHYAFLDDPRTRSVVAEPRADNFKMIDYFAACGFHRQRAFDFPHKRAALMVLPREVFFEEHCP